MMIFPQGYEQKYCRAFISTIRNSINYANSWLHYWVTPTPRQPCHSKHHPIIVGPDYFEKVNQSCTLNCQPALGLCTLKEACNDRQGSPQDVLNKVMRHRSRLMRFVPQHILRPCHRHYAYMVVCQAKPPDQPLISNICIN